MKHCHFCPWAAAKTCLAILLASVLFGCGGSGNNPLTQLTPPPPASGFLYAASQDGDLYTFPEFDDVRDQGTYQHSSLLAGGEAMCAGTIMLREGRLLTISNLSGHYKPGLAALRGQLLPPSVQMGQRLTTMTQNQRQLLLPGIAPFRRHGRSGAWLCDFLPHTGAVADELCFIRSMHTEAINHAPAMTLFLSGAEQPAHHSRQEGMAREEAAASGRRRRQAGAGRPLRLLFGLRGLVAALNRFRRRRCLSRCRRLVGLAAAAARAGAAAGAGVGQ